MWGNCLRRRYRVYCSLRKRLVFFISNDLGGEVNVPLSQLVGWAKRQRAHQDTWNNNMASGQTWPMMGTLRLQNIKLGAHPTSGRRFRRFFDRVVLFTVITTPYPHPYGACGIACATTRFGGGAARCERPCALPRGTRGKAQGQSGFQVPPPGRRRQAFGYLIFRKQGVVGDGDDHQGEEGGGHEAEDEGPGEA